jgi:Spy/CpxP family protein refolding chaperone
MICSMGMLPHPGMGSGMGMMDKPAGGMMQHGAAAGGAQQGAAAGHAQHGAAAGVPPGAAAGHAQHGAAATGVQQGAAAGGMQHGAAAQAGHDMGGMDHPVTPAMLMHHAEDLALTAEQQAKVSELAKTSQAACEQHLDAAAAAHKAAAALLDKDAPDLAAYQAKLRETTDHVLQGHLAVVKAGLEGRAILTPEQAAKLKH